MKHKFKPGDLVEVDNYYDPSELGLGIVLEFVSRKALDPPNEIYKIYWTKLDKIVEWFVDEHTQLAKL